ncbi:MAG: hypothetical protein IKW26_07945 [Treponema sp.]|nr:hypothetical protein [Treponema sp.]
MNWYTLVKVITITIILSIISFFSLNIDFIPYISVCFAIFISGLILFDIKKNQKVFICFFSVLLINLGIFLGEKYLEGYRICFDVIDYIYIGYFSLLILIFIISIFALLLGKRKNQSKAENFFSEREDDCKLLLEYLRKYPIVGLQALWGDGKTFLCNYLKSKNTDFYYISISLMTLQIDTVEKILVNELNSLFKLKRIFSLASSKANNYIEKNIPHGLGEFLTKNESYTELYESIIDGVNKLDKPVVVSFEDIDRINEQNIIFKLFSIVELLSSKTNMFKVCYQYDVDKLIEILKIDSKYLEKYIPFHINLTPIGFERTLKVLLESGKAEKLYKNILLEDISFIYQRQYLDFDLRKLINIESEFAITYYFTIRSVVFFLDELDQLLELQEYKNNKKILITFLSIKHFLPHIYKSLSPIERFAECKFFEYEKENKNIAEIIALFQTTEDGKKNELFQSMFPPHSDNLSYLAIFHLFGYKFFIKNEDSSEGDERIKSLLNEEADSIEIEEHNDKIDRLIWNMLYFGKSDKTDKENAVREFEKILDNDTFEKQVNMYKVFSERAFYGNFEKPDNSTIFLWGIDTFFPVFQGFRVYERNPNYWIKLIDFYFEYAEIKSITASLIHNLNICNISFREVYFHIISKFNELDIKGNLNSTECYPKFLREYIGAFSRLGFIDTHELDWYSIGNKPIQNLEKYKDFYCSITNKLSKLKKNSPIDVIKNETKIMKEFLKKNDYLMMADNSLKEYESRIKTSSSCEDSLKKIYDEIESNGLTGEKLRNYLSEKYKNNEIPAYGIERIWEKYGEKE